MRAPAADYGRQISLEREIIMSENLGTIWVCIDCMLHHANGECGGCDDDERGHDQEPLSRIAGPQHVAMGMVWGEHSCGREVAPLECDCETNTFSTSRCEGCGSYLHGERHAMTLFAS
jgi:hypothetical protein